MARTLSERILELEARVNFLEEIAAELASALEAAGFSVPATDPVSAWWLEHDRRRIRAQRQPFGTRGSG